MNLPAAGLGVLVALTLPTLAGCDAIEFSQQNTNLGHSDDHDDHEHLEELSIKVTHFNDFAQLYVEFPVLTVDEESHFAAHFTRLDGFQPVAMGSVRVILQGADLPDEVFSVDQPSIPGLFIPAVVPKHAGEREVTLLLESVEHTSVHNLGIHTVYANREAIPVIEEADDSDTISYTKEQQWQVDFATAPVSARTLRESIRAVATIKAAADSEVKISAPHDGQLVRRGKSFPTIGTRIRKGQVLAVIGSPLGRELKTLDKVVSGTALRAPIAGVIAQVHAMAGSYLEKGAPIFHIVDAERLWLESRIPESDVLRLIDSDGAWFSLPNVTEPFLITTRGDDSNGRVVALNQSIDPRTRTASLVFEFTNPGQMLRIGMLLEAHIFTGKNITSTAVPLSAIVRDNGVPVVFVEVGGESFERRVLQLGIRDGDYIEVRNGVSNGERVVSKGAYLVKLAASGSAEAGHGHAH